MLQSHDRVLGPLKFELIVRLLKQPRSDLERRGNEFVVFAYTQVHVRSSATGRDLEDGRRGGVANNTKRARAWTAEGKQQTRRLDLDENVMTHRLPPERR